MAPGLDVGGGIIPSCAPEDLSNWRFFNALNGEAWMNNATLYGHADFMDPDWVPTILSVSKQMSNHWYSMLRSTVVPISKK